MPYCGSPAAIEVSEQVVGVAKGVVLAGHSPDYEGQAL
jgi:hypothetical protein